MRSGPLCIFRQISSRFLLFLFHFNTIDGTGSGSVLDTLFVSGIFFVNKRLFRLIVKAEDVGTEFYTTLTSDTFIFIYFYLKQHLQSPKK